MGPLSAALLHPGSGHLPPPRWLDTGGGQFWLGATTEERHSEGSPGNWMWPHKNESVTWFDWGDGQPNNLRGQNCVTMMEEHDPFFPIFRDYFWNDFDCDMSAHYICEHKCFDQFGNRSP